MRKSRNQGGLLYFWPENTEQIIVPLVQTISSFEKMEPQFHLGHIKLEMSERTRVFHSERSVPGSHMPE
jgi:hypothetical protein